MTDELRAALRRAAGPPSTGVDMGDVRRRARTHDSHRRVGAVLVAVVLPLVAAGIIAGVAADRRGGVRFDAVTAPAPAASPFLSPTAPAATPTPTDDDRLLAFQALAPGLFCRDLAAQGFSYPQAVAYWLREGIPERMDIDLDGVPCQTVYPQAEVEAFLGGGSP